MIAKMKLKFVGIEQSTVEMQSETILAEIPFSGGDDFYIFVKTPKG
jgi:hypothetical protein